MSARDELRDPWGWLVAAVCGGLAWAVLGTPGVGAVLVGLLIGVAVLTAKVAVGAARTRAGRPPAIERPRDRLPEAPRDSIQATLLARSHAAVDRIEDLAGRPSDQWIAGEIRSVLTDSRPVVEAIAEMAGRVTLLDSSIVAARPNALAQEIALLQGQLQRTTDPEVRREQDRALAALDKQADSVDRLLRRRDSAVAQMQASAVGLESLAARSGELVALGPAGQDTEEATRIVADLTDSLDAVHTGVDEARSLLRDL
ncbi:MAG TPA: hypothetical protein VES03_09840 [Motilibacterales bacterium]|nr:hypothetical protein [Motilibacterales bacterium]